MTPDDFFNLLSDETRLRCLLLLQIRKEICVCEFSQGLDIIQPKISRHLAHLRKMGLVLDERRGQWVYYQIHPNLDKWMQKVIKVTFDYLKNTEPYISDIKKFRAVCNNSLCCK